jgi:hypothetical protein
MRTHDFFCDKKMPAQRRRRESGGFLDGIKAIGAFQKCHSRISMTPFRASAG